MTTEYRNKAKQKELETRENIKKNIDHLLTEAEVRATLGGICRQTIYMMLKRGHFPEPMHIGSRKYWRKSVVERWLDVQQPIAA